MLWEQAALVRDSVGARLKDLNTHSITATVYYIMFALCVFKIMNLLAENSIGRLKMRCLMKRNDSNIELVKSMLLTCAYQRGLPT